MHSSLALVALATAAYAAPTEFRSRNIFGDISHDINSFFTIPQVLAAEKVFKNGALEMMRTYQKYAKHGAVAPLELIAAANNAQIGSATATPEQYDEAYLVEVQVGDQTLTLDFDTGSSDLWVFSTVTPANERGSHTLYNPNDSGSLEQGESWSIAYGDGSGASGTVYADKVVVGGVTATSQAVEAATSVSSAFLQDPSDGLLGLGFSSINTVTPNQATTFFDTVKSTLASQLFTADLKAGQPGSYDFGYIDSSKYTGSIAYTTVNTENGFWQFTADGYSVGSSTSTSGSIGTGIADTGTSLFYLPDDVVSAYYAQVSGSSNSQVHGGYVFSCGTTLPDFHVSIAGQVLTVPGSYMNFAPVDSNGEICFGGIQSSDGIGFNIFGDIFLKAVFVVFDESYGAPCLGFANKPTGTTSDVQQGNHFMLPASALD